MPTDPLAPANRVRPWMLLLLGAAVVAGLMIWRWKAAGTDPAPSNQTRAGRSTQNGPANPASLDVRLDALKQPPPQPMEADRNPFRFQPPRPPPPPPLPPRPVQVAPSTPSPLDPPVVPPPPPIPLKFMGFIDARGPGKIVALTDGAGYTFHGQEGSIIDGRYRIVKVGVESIVMEYLDGRGRQTIPMRGQ